MNCRLVVLASGDGSNLQALIDAMGTDIVGVYCNREKARALDRARTHGIPAWYCPLPPFLARGLSREDYDADLAQQVQKLAPDLVVLAGWMHIFSRAFVDPLPIINLHPAWLPENPAEDRVQLPDGTWSPVFRGAHALEDALAHGVSYVGSSVHQVTPEVDRGRLIKRTPLPVSPGETVAAVRSRLQVLEHQLLPAAVAECIACRHIKR